MSKLNLQLDRSKIEGCITSYPDYDSHKYEKKGDERHIFLVKVKGVQVPAMLNIMHLKSGNTSISTGVGKNQPLSENIGDYIIENSLVEHIDSRKLYLKTITDAHFAALLASLLDYQVTIVSTITLNTGTKYDIQHEDGGLLHLNRFNSGAFSVQGSSDILKRVLVDILTNILPYKDVIDVQLQSLNLNITAEEVIHELQKVMPNAYAYLGDTLKSIMSPSIALASVDLDLADYSAIVFPVLRGLEGYIKKLMIEHGMVIGESMVGNFFDINPADGEYFLQPTHGVTINNPVVISAINVLYTFYKNQRHVTFHVNGVIDTTRIIENRQEALELIDDAFAIIERTYSNIIA